jgi:Uma2 family endonuclease
VLSPRERGVQRKVEDYLTSGARAVWVVRPRDRTVAVHHAAASPRVFQKDEMLEDAVVMPGFRYPLRDLFENIPRR